MFSPRHIPGNLFAMFFSAPKAVVAPGSSVLQYPYWIADPWSLSLLFVAPVFGFVLLAPTREWIVRGAVLTSLIMVVPILSYYGTGATQFGYRYALDFFPLLYLVLCRAFAPRLPAAICWLIAASALFNAYLLWHFRF